VCMIVTRSKRHVVTVARVPLLAVGRAGGAFFERQAVDCSVFPRASGDLIT